MLLVQQDLTILAVGAGGAELGRPAPVFLPVGQLPLDVLHRRAAAVTEPGRELLRAVLTEVAVFQFLIAQQSDLLAADVAVFLIKQSHNSFLLLFSAAVTAHIALSPGTGILSQAVAPAAGDGIRQKIRYSLLFFNFLKLHHFVRRFRPVHRQLQSAAVLAGPGTVVNVQDLPQFRAVRLLENTVSNISPVSCIFLRGM